MNNMKLTRKQADETAIHNGGKYHLLWKCETGDKRHRPFGKAMTEGCGKLNVRTTKNPDGVKGRCIACERRRNLNDGNVQYYISRESAIEAAYNMEWFA